ncbi:hypothetical protein E3N88_08530 [Mikania micrantha]|uniref:Uncharacterized protein n=1 Tax=Mikania micrantha TaxID=192012 RepID=A0A5N6PGJ5_9ASTR|nr:hypothetical protein E3N88_08530 [Mikania micrantha]
MLLHELVIRLLSRLLWNRGDISGNSKTKIRKVTPFSISQFRKNEFDFRKIRHAYILEDKKGTRIYEEPRDPMEEDNVEEGDEVHEKNEYERYERGQQEGNYIGKPITWGTWSKYGLLMIKLHRRGI